MPLTYLRNCLLRVALVLAACGFADRSLAIDVVVSRITGQISLVNNSESSAPIFGYSINSTIGALLPANWLSIAANYDGNSGDLIDPDDNWTIISSTTGSLAEGQIGGGGPNNGGTLLPGQSLSLGLAWDPFRTQDLTANLLLSGGGPSTPVTPIYTTFSADFDENLRVDRADLSLWRLCFLGGCGIGDADDNGVVDGQDYFVWLEQVGSSGPIPPPGSIGMGGGFGASAVAIPEPSSIALFTVGLFAAFAFRRRVS